MTCQCTMNMTQLVFGATLGFLLAQAVLYCIKRFIGWLRRDELRARMRTLMPPSGRAIAHASIQYAVLLGAAAALITLGVWAFGDYFAGRSARGATGSDSEPSVALPPAPAAEAPKRLAELAPAPKAEASTATPVESADPYADADFKVRHRAHHAGTRTSLKETLLQRAEAKARDELLGETKQHQNRSQYDCEAADRAVKYLKAGLDVWGFAAWQVKHFPLDGYEGATLSQCQNITDVVDPSRFDMHDAIVQGNDPGRDAPRDPREGRAATPAGEAGKSRP
jgi:hypothetical protein